jgi:hypothetical protein
MKQIFAYIRYKEKEKQYILFLSKEKENIEVEICYITYTEYQNFTKMGIPLKENI